MGVVQLKLALLGIQDFGLVLGFRSGPGPSNPGTTCPGVSRGVPGCPGVPWDNLIINFEFNI